MILIEEEFMMMLEMNLQVAYITRRSTVPLLRATSENFYTMSVQLYHENNPNFTKYVLIRRKSSYEREGIPNKHIL